jgi:hypothetical protein
MQDSIFDAEVPGLLGRPAFWIGGALSVACWAALAVLLVLLL